MHGTQRIRIGSWELDGSAGTLRKDGREVPIQAKPLALLLALIERRDRIATKRELIEAVWPGVRVSEAAFTSALRDLRRALGDRGFEPGVVQTLRGRGLRLAQPVEVSALRESVAEQAAPDFVGRAELLRVFDGELAATRAGRGQVAFLVGEAGIGKTRTSLEIAARARAADCAVHFGRCLEEEGAPPYRPWIQLLRSLLAGRAPRALEPALDAKASDAIACLLGIGSTARRASAEAGAARRFEMFDAVAQLLRDAARQQARLLVLDDLHRADPSSLLLLRHLVHEIADAPVMLLGTYRPAEVGEPLLRLLDALHPTGARIALPGLSRDEVAALVERVAGRSASQDLASALHARTGGNPLFVEEILRTLAAEGLLDSPEAASRATRVSPEGVRQVIRSRVGRLTAPTRTALDVASVIGRDFDLSILERVCALDADSLARAAQAAVDAGVLGAVHDRPGRFRFVHILLRDAVYDALPSNRRVALHGQVGRALEGLEGAERDAAADALAHHFEQAIPAGEAARALRWARRAAELALSRAAYEEAAVYAARALQASALASPGEPRTRAELSILLGRARWSGGATDAARQAFQQALELARAAAEPDLFARAALGFTGRTDATPGVNRVAVALLEEALALLPESETALRAEVMARLGTELYYDADPHRGDELTQCAVALAGRTGDDALLAYALSARHYQLVRPQVEPAARLAVGDRVVALAERSEARDVLAIGLQDRSFDLLEQGDGLRLENCLHAYERVVAQLRQPFFRWYLGFLRGMWALLNGQWEEAERLAHETLALGQAFGTPNALGVFSVQLFAIRREQGRIAELEAPLRAMVREQPDLPAFRTGLAAIAGECGRREEARDALRQLVEGDLDRFPRDRNWLVSLSSLVPAAAIAGAPELTQRVYALLAPCSGQVIGVGHGAGCDGAVDHQLGVLATALGDADLADEHFTAARALHRQLRSPLWLAHTQREQARALWKRGTPGDREQARGLQAEATRAYERMGLPHRAGQARAITDFS